MDELCLVSGEIVPTRDSAAVIAQWGIGDCHVEVVRFSPDRAELIAEWPGMDREDVKNALFAKACFDDLRSMPVFTIESGGRMKHAMTIQRGEYSRRNLHGVH